MNGYNFTEHVRQVLGRAREEAAALNHEYLGCEHITLALLSSEGVANTVLYNLGLEFGQACDAIKRTVEVGRTDAARTGPDLPYTSRAKKTIELAMTEARDLNHSYVGTEHLLLGLLRENENIGAQVLQSMGITIDTAREETLRILGVEMPRPPLAPPVGERPKQIGITFRYSNGAVVSMSFSDTAAAARFLTGQ